MAEKKVKIDLKSRLGRASSGTPQVPSSPGSIPPPTGIAPPPGIMPSSGIPAPPFAPKPAGPKINKADPFAAVSADEVQTKPAEIKLDISQDVVKQSEQKSRKAAIIAAGLAAIIFGGLGFVWGGAKTRGDQDQLAVKGALELSKDVEKTAKDIKTIVEKVTAANKSLYQDKKFPDAFAGEMKDIKLSFDASLLAGKNFNRLKPTTLRNLVEFSSSVQDLDDRREKLVRLFENNKKDVQALLESGSNPRMSYAVFMGKTDNGPVATFARIKEPIEFKKAWPDKFGLVGIGEVIEADRYKSGEPFVKPGATPTARPTVYATPIEPDGIMKVFPSDVGKRIESELAAVMTLTQGTPDGVAPVGKEKTGLLKLTDDLLKDLREIGRKR